MNLRRAAVALPLWFAACAIPPKDPFLAAQFALERDDLLRALQCYDAVPVAHPQYPDARAGAVAVELRVRRCHELILEALVLRGQWRDREALVALRRAREHWPTEPSLDRWIAATEHRLEALGARPRELAVRSSGDHAASAAPLVEPRPAAEVLQREGARPGSATRVLVLDSPTVPSPADASPRPAADESVTPPAAEPTVAAAPVVVATARPPLAQDPAGLGLVSVEARLALGELEGAAADLLELARRHPEDMRVRRRLGRLLHQRALLRYGQGALDAAIDDWQRVREIEPDNEVVQKLLERALGERR